VYVTAYGTYGHTALVHNVNGAYVDVLEQNGSCRSAAPLSPHRFVPLFLTCAFSGEATYSIAGAECFLRSS
jgi:surface antigen